MKRIALSALAAALVGLGAAAVANAEVITTTPYTPATTCMNCK